MAVGRESCAADDDNRAPAVRPIPGDVQGEEAESMCGDGWIFDALQFGLDGGNSLHTGERSRVGTAACDNLQVRHPGVNCHYYLSHTC